MKLRHVIPLILLAVSAGAEETSSSVSIDQQYTDLLVSKAGQQVRRAVPRKAVLPQELQCTVLRSEETSPKINVSTTRKGYKITVPENFNSWAFQPDNALLFLNTFLSARLGRRDLSKETWISAALVHEIYEPGIFYGYSGYGEKPYTKTLLAYGFAPPVKHIFENTPSDFQNGAYSTIQMEWSVILYSICQKNDGPGSIERYFSESGSPQERFAKHIFSQNSSVQGKRKLSFSREQSLQEWFYQKATNELLSRSTPASIPRIEREYSEISKELRTFLNRKNEQKKEEFTLSEEDILQLSRISVQLNRLAAIAPEKISLQLFRFGHFLYQLRNEHPGKNWEAKIASHEQAVYLAMNERVAVETFLKQAEQKLIPPGVRWAATVKAVSPSPQEIPLLIRADQLLDRFEKVY